MLQTPRTGFKNNTQNSYEVILKSCTSFFKKLTTKNHQRCNGKGNNRFTFSISIRSNHPEMFLRKGAPTICNKFTGEHPCRSVISIKLQSNLIEITLRHGCSPVNLLHIFRTPFPKNTSGWLLLKYISCSIFLLNFKLLSHS